MSEPIKPPSLVRKLSNVMGEISRVAKTGHNNFHHYDYATESDITAAVRSSMAEQGVMLIPTVEKIDWTESKTASGKVEKLCTVGWLFTLLDADSEQKIEFRNVGQGQDSGDKAFYKAATGAVKYALLKLFLIPTGDDPEADSKPQQRSAPIPRPEHRAHPVEQPARLPTADAVARPRQHTDSVPTFVAPAPGLVLGGRADNAVAALKSLGVSLEDLVKRLKRSPVESDAEQLERWLKATKKKLSAPKVDAEEAARLEVQKQAEASLAESDAKRAAAIPDGLLRDGPEQWHPDTRPRDYPKPAEKVPATKEQREEAFQGYVGFIKAATAAAQLAVKKLEWVEDWRLTDQDRKALGRSSGTKYEQLMADAVLVVEDRKRRANMQIDDKTAGDVPF